MGAVLIPRPSKPWAEAIRLVGSRPPRGLAELEGKSPSYDRLPLYNDFCLHQDAVGRWHCIGILFEGTSREDFRQDRLFHYVADRLEGPYRSVGYLDLGHGKASGVWAPFVIRDGKRTLIFYANPENRELTIRVAEATDSELRSWRRALEGKDLVVAEPAARDPQIMRDRRTGQYLMYYVAATPQDPNVPSKGIVRVRVSRDLISWSKPRTVLGTPSGYVVSESVFVLERNGYYYMWISGFDYARMSLYISTDPFNFGDADANRIEEQPGHAPEIVRSKGKDWMACVAIASVPGLTNGKDLPIAQHDLEGVYLQPLEWGQADPAVLSRITRS